jgi:hypothetical protein
MDHTRVTMNRDSVGNEQNIKENEGRAGPISINLQKPDSTSGSCAIRVLAGRMLERVEDEGKEDTPEREGNDELEASVCLLTHPLRMML